MAAFRLGRTPVTNAQYGAFVEATGQPPPAAWPGGTLPLGRELHPVTYVSWDEAAAFCRWAGGLLPTEAQWERAARGDDRRTWPWGDDPPRPAHAVLELTDTRPVGGRAAGAGPFGHLDLAGNAWEWTSSLLRAYPYDPRRRSRGGRPGPARRARRRVHPRPGRGALLVPARDAARDGRPLRRLPPRFGAGIAVDGVELLDVPAGVARLGNDAPPFAGRRARRRGAAARVRGRGRRAHGDARDERAVRGIRRRDRKRRAVHWRTARPGGARTTSRDARRLARRGGVLRLGRRTPADRGRVGEGRARRRRAPLPVGRRRPRAGAGRTPATA